MNLLSFLDNSSLFGGGGCGRQAGKRIFAPIERTELERKQPFAATSVSDSITEE